MGRLSRKFAFAVLLGTLYFPALAKAQNECAAVNPGYMVLTTTRDSSGIVHQVTCQDPITAKVYPTAWFIIGGSGSLTLPVQLGTSVGPPTFSIASNAYSSGMPQFSFNTTTVEPAGSNNGPVTVASNFAMNINPPSGSRPIEAWTLNSLAYTDATNASNFTSELVGFHGEFDHLGSGTVNAGFGVSGENFIIGSGTETAMYGTYGSIGTWTGSTGNVTQANALAATIWNMGSGTISTANGLHVTPPNGSAGTITNFNGIQIDNLAVTGVTNAIAINVTANDSNFQRVNETQAVISGAASDSLPCLRFTNGTTTNPPGWCANALSGNSEILIGTVNNSKIIQIDSTYGQTLVNRSGLGFAFSGTSRDSGIFPLAAGILGIGNGTVSSTSGGYLLGTTGFSAVSTSGVTAGNPVKLDTGNANQVNPTVTTDTGAGIPVGIAIVTTGASSPTYIATNGQVATPVLGTGTCAIAQFVIVDTTTNGRVKCTSTFTAGTVIGKALQAQSTVGNALNVLVQLQ